MSEYCQEPIFTKIKHWFIGCIRCGFPADGSNNSLVTQSMAYSLMESWIDGIIGNGRKEKVGLIGGSRSLGCDIAEGYLLASPSPCPAYEPSSLFYCHHDVLSSHRHTVSYSGDCELNPLHQWAKLNPSSFKLFLTYLPKWWDDWQNRRGNSLFLFYLLASLRWEEDF